MRDDLLPRGMPPIVQQTQRLLLAVAQGVRNFLRNQRYCGYRVSEAVSVTAYFLKENL